MQPFSSWALHSDMNAFSPRLGWVGSATSGSRKFHSEIPIFQIFSPSSQKNLFLSGQKISGSKGRLAPYLLWVKSMLGLGQDPSLCRIHWKVSWKFRCSWGIFLNTVKSKPLVWQVKHENSELILKGCPDCKWGTVGILSSPWDHDRQLKFCTGVVTYPFRSCFYNSAVKSKPWVWQIIIVWAD